METYYNPEDLAKFGTIGEEAPSWRRNSLTTTELFLRREP